MPDRKNLLTIVLLATTAMITGACSQAASSNEGAAPSGGGPAAADVLSVVEGASAAGSGEGSGSSLDAGFAKNADGYADISVDDLATLLASTDVTLVNTHIPFEGDIPGTDVSIPYDQIEAHLDELPADRDAPIVLYCRSGSMSTDAARRLAKLGYTNIMELDDGFRAWQSTGHPFDRGQ
ncbi:MAG: rhodanese-like domain-containing protein [Anaerolineae bacterium]